MNTHTHTHRRTVTATVMREDASHEWTVVCAWYVRVCSHSFARFLSSTPMTHKPLFHTPEVVEEGQAREVGQAFVVERAFFLVTGHRGVVEGRM